MRTVLDALVPIFTLILLGYGLRHRFLSQVIFWQGMSKLVYFLLLPALLIVRLAASPLELRTVLPVWGVVIPTMLLVAGVTWLLWPRQRLSAPGFTSLLQGTIRPNTYTGLALVGALYGNEGLAYAAIALAGMVPLANFLSVGGLVCYGDAPTTTAALPSNTGIAWRFLCLSLIRNPLLIACAIGIGLNLTGIGLPRDAHNILAVLAQAALPIGLLTVGAGLRPDRLHHAPYPLTLATTLKLGLSPAVAWGLATIGKTDTIISVVGVLFVAIPCATSSYILAEQMGGDAELMAGILTVETLAAVVTLPVIMVLLGV